MSFTQIVHHIKAENALLSLVLFPSYILISFYKGNSLGYCPSLVILRAQIGTYYCPIQALPKLHAG